MLTIYGSSDDLIETEGDVYEEFTVTDGLAYVYLSTGQAFRFRFEPEGWRVSVLATSAVPLPVSTLNEQGDEVITIQEPVRWVSVSEQPPALAS
jgi:hypothetical protein